MAKQITKTPAITAQMQKIMGDGVDTSKLPIYEAIAGNSLPLTKTGSIFHKAVIQESSLNDLASSINASGLPLHTLHSQGSELPVGKVFHGQVVQNDQGQPELHVLFSVDPATQLPTGLDNGTIDEVSLGFLAAHALCSACGWDYFGADASLSNFWDRTCPNEHTIGQDGAHLNLNGLDKAYEMSLVSQGAVQGSKILSPSMSKLSGVVGQRLAASGLDLNAAVLFTTWRLNAADTTPSKGDYGPHSQARYADPGYQKDKKPRYPLAVGGKLNEERIRAAWDYIHKAANQEPYTSAQVDEIKQNIVSAWKEAIDPAGPPGAAEAKNNSTTTDPRALAASKEHNMEVNFTELVTQLTGAKADVVVKDAKLADLTAQVTALTARVVELTAKIPATPAETEAKLVELGVAVSFLKEHTRKALVATGADASKVDTMSVEEMTKAISDAQAKLSTLFPAGGKSLSSTQDAEKDVSPDLAAFKTRK